MAIRKHGWLQRKRSWRRDSGEQGEPRIALALGGGFARGIAHVGILRVLERERIPLHCITGVSAGAIVAAAFASGATSAEIGVIGAAMKFADIARWNLCRLGLVGSERMTKFLPRLLRYMRFEDMQIPLGIIATDVAKGAPVIFREQGDVALAIRASCSYPGLFRPVEAAGRVLVDGAISVEVPSQLARTMGATHVISVCIPSPQDAPAPNNMFEVINRCFQIMMARTEDSWRQHSDAVLTPEVGVIPWDGFGNAQRLIEAGEAAAEHALPRIRQWLTTNRLKTPKPSALPALPGQSGALIQA
jgi:NTE family protein